MFLWEKSFPNMQHLSTSSGFLTSGWRGLGVRVAVERKGFLIKESREIIYHPRFSLYVIRCKAVFFHWPPKHLVVPSSCGRAPKPRDQMSDALRTQSGYRLCLKHRTQEHFKLLHFSAPVQRCMYNLFKI